jgi:hypothetical protein
MKNQFEIRGILGIACFAVLIAWMVGQVIYRVAVAVAAHR